MNHRTRKEFRENLPVTALLALAMGVGAMKPFDPDFGQFLVVMSLVFGSGYLGAMPLVREMQINDGSWFLAQPIARGCLWREKFLPASACWIVLLAVFAACSHAVFESATGWGVFRSNLVWCCAAMFCAGPLSALLCRHSWPALLLACGSPFPVMISIVMIHGELPVVLTSCCNAFFGLALLFAGFRLFQRCEAAPTLMNTTLHLPLPLAGTPSNKTQSANQASRTPKPLVALIRKDVRLVLPTLTISAAMSALMALALLLTGPASGGSFVDGMNLFFHMVQIGLMPGLAAVALVSGDRAPGVREQLMTTPVSARAQWLLKLGIAFAASCLIVLCALSAAAFSPFDHHNNGLLNQRIATTLVVACCIALVSLYGATTSFNTVRSLATAFMLVIGACVLFVQMNGWITRAAFPSGQVHMTFAGDNLLLIAHRLFPQVFPLLLLLILTPLGFRNMRQIRTPQEIGLQLSGLVAGGAILLAAAGAIL